MLRYPGKRSLTLLAVSALLAGCGGMEPGEGEGPTAPTREMYEPALRMVAPTSISVGEELVLFGSGFEKEMGKTMVSFEGIFLTSSGKIVQVKLDVTPTYVNQGKLSWTFGPNIPFTTEEDTGRFRGVIRVRNVGLDGKVKPGVQALGSEIQVLPSILVRQARPLGAGCAPGLSATTEDTKFLFEVKAIGLKAGTQTEPLRFIYSFLKQNFNFQGYLSGVVSTDPESLFPQTGPVSVIEDVTDGTISRLGSGAPKNIYINKGAYTSGMGSLTMGLDKLFGLTYLTTATVPSAGDYFDATMNIVAIDSKGAEAKRTLKMRVWAPIEVEATGGAQPVRSYDPLPVSGCIPGGDIGRSVTYSELTSETRTREYKIKSTISAGFDIKVVRLNAEFGIEVTSQVSSTKSKSLIFTGYILPKQYGIFYRQTLQLERKGTLTAHGLCGSTQDLGEVVVTDWTWSPDLAKGSTCPPLPPSNLPKGQSYSN